MIESNVMSNKTISLDLPNDIFLALNESESEIKNRIKLNLAFQLYEQNKLTIGKAAQLSGMMKLEFEKELSKNKISISNLTEKDVIDDVDKLMQ